MKDEHDQRRAKVTDEHRREAAALLAIWNSTAELRKANQAGSQLAFGHKYDVGNQSAVGFFLNGKTPLSLKAARGFAKGLGCKISDFSPRLARMVEADLVLTDAAGQRTIVEVKSPADDLSPRALSLARRIDALANEKHAEMVYATAMNLLKGFEAEERALQRTASVPHAEPTPARHPRKPQPIPAR